MQRRSRYVRHPSALPHVANRGGPRVRSSPADMRNRAAEAARLDLHCSGRNRHSLLDYWMPYFAGAAGAGGGGGVSPVAGWFAGFAAGFTVALGAAFTGAIPAGVAGFGCSPR